MFESEFPIIDISKLSNQQHRPAIAEQISHASQTWGFLLLKNHPIGNTRIESMFSLARQFFIDTPEDEKTPYGMTSAYNGYVASFFDGPKDDKSSMWLSGRPGDLKNRLQDLPPFWRSRVPEVEEFKHECHKLVQQLLDCFALAMGLPQGYFADAHDENGGSGTRFRMICYPARSSGPPTQTTRMTAHTDSGSVTLLFQTCAGLEVESPSGKWVEAPHAEDCILVNLGDALAFWSGSRLKATKHRVTFGTVPYEVERMTMAYFAAASPDTVLHPIENMGNVNELRDYQVNGIVIQPGITVGEYETKIMESIYGKAVDPQSTTSAA